MERACLTKLSGTLEADCFDFLLVRQSYYVTPTKRNTTVPLKNTSLKEKKAEIEYGEIINALELTNGNKTAAANYLQIDRSLLYRRLKKMGIE